MSFNIFDEAKNIFSGELINKLSAHLNETPAATQKAVSGLVPTIVSSLLDKTETTEGTSSLFSMINDATQSGDIAGKISGFLGNDHVNAGLGTTLVNTLFGNKTSGVANIISQFSGIKNSSASSLLSFITPIILSLFGRETAKNNLGVSGIGSLFAGQKSNLLAMIPSGLGILLSSMGISKLLGSFGNTETPVVTATAFNTTTDKKEYVEEPVSNGGNKWLIPLLLLLLAAGAIWYFTGMKGCNADTNAVSKDSINLSRDSINAQANTELNNIATDFKGKLDSITGEYWYNLGKIVNFELPNAGGKLEVGEFSTEAKLINFLNDQNAVLDTAKGNWFEFTNVKFKTGGAEISDTSLAQLKNLVLIAKAYPNARFKIGGYTDNTGDTKANVALSQKRADAVAKKVLALGAPAASFIASEGFGPEWPIADNATAEGRAQNRRVAVNVKAK